MGGFESAPATNLTLPTPLDGRRLVDPQKTILDLRRVIAEPEEGWAEPNIHHLQWPKRWYPNTSGDMHDPTNPAAFRHLPIHRLWLPRDLHQILHDIMEPPPVPDPDVMFYRVEAWNVARSLFLKARPLVYLPRRQRIEQELLKIDEAAIERPVQDESILKAVDAYLNIREALQRRIERIPPEFQIVRSDQHDPEEVAKAAGRAVLPKAQSYSLTVGLPLAA